MSRPVRSEVGERIFTRSSLPSVGNKNELRHKVAIRFAIEGDLRFISHHDTMRLFERALARASLPVKFSEGFNPRPKLSLPLPRGVGIASDCELLVIQLDSGLEPSAVRAGLAEQMPTGLTLIDACGLEGGISPQPVQVTHAVRVDGDRWMDVRRGLDTVRAATSWPIRRSGPGDRAGKTIDLVAFLTSAALAAGELQWTSRVGPDGSLRPAEFLSAVGLARETYLHRVRRTSVAWTPEITG